MKNKNIAAAFFVLAAGAGVGVHAQAPGPAAPPKNEPLSMKYSAVTNDVPFKILPNACAVRLAPVVDARQNKDTLGSNAGSALLSGDAGVWSTDGLRNLSNFGFKVEDIGAGASKNGTLTLEPQIIRAYTWQIGLKLFATVVVKMDYLKADGSIEHKTYRASGNKTNMWGANYEFMDALNYAFNNLLRDLASDVEQRCPRRA